jgi:hypothetical protein
MASVDGRPRGRIGTTLVVAVYAAFLLIAPFEHHDFLCHFKTPQHCTACTSSLVGANPNTPIAAAPVHLADAGGAMTFHPVVTDILLTVRSTGRSPPHA